MAEEKKSTHTNLALVVTFVLGLGFLLTGCNSNSQQKQEKPAQRPVLKIEDFPKLQKQLFELASAEKPEEYAKRANIELKDGRVQVVLEIAGAEWADDILWAIEATGGRVETKYENLIQASVPIEALLALAKHPRVIYLRLPARPEP